MNQLERSANLMEWASNCEGAHSVLFMAAMALFVTSYYSYDATGNAYALVVAGWVYMGLSVVFELLRGWLAQKAGSE